MGERIQRMTSAEVEQILHKNGFWLISQHGSHKKWRHTEKRLQVIVSEHSGRDLPIGTIRAIFTTAEIPESEWKS